jgi:hypothetical protein
MPGVAAFPVGDITFLSLLFNFYGYYLPIFLYAAWTPLALYELSDNRLNSNFSKAIWTLVILLVPLLGAAVYHIFFADRIHVTGRATMIFGGILTVIIVLIYLGLSL